ncbi:hypothetical protein MHYP_G00070990 [Metynnis hypsauchen]
MERRPPARFETQSFASRGAQASVSSKSSIAFLQAKAKAEAAQTRATFIKKEAKIKLEQARLQAALDSLRADEELEAARAEMHTLEAGLIEMGCEIRSHASSSDLEEAKTQLVAKYVLEQRSVNTGDTPYQVRHADVSTPNPHAATDLQAPTNHTAADYRPPLLLRAQPDNSPLPRPSNGPPPVPAPRRSSTRVPDHGDYQSFNLTSDLAKFLARSCLVTSGLTSFDDQPINYWAWRASFKSAIAGLDLSAAEELDLLVKYLGKHSAEQIKRIKAVNIRHPPAGLSLAWERLEETYGSPEAIEHALFTKVEKFPKVSSNDPQKLRDLADLLSELEYAKLDGSLPGLSYLDTARGIHPIVEKLPHNIQEKWISYGAKYKRTHLVSFPPFSIFVKFVLAEAKARTDPSFNLFASSSTPANVKKGYSDRSAKTPVMVHKTQVSSTGESHRDKECWYLPLFGVYHPKKPEKIRIVFDSSAAYDGVSLNDVLITGPDLNNSLVGLLMRFRKEAVAITADVEHMFHCFVVKEDLRFLWYQNNDMATDYGSRSVPAALLSGTTWLKGPAFLTKPSLYLSVPQETYDLVNPAADSEIRPQVTANLMHIPEDTMQPKRFERFSKLSTLIRAIAHLIHIARTFSHSTLTSSCRSWHICQPSVEEKAQAKVCILKSVQKECYQEEIKCIRERLNISSSSSLCKLNPILDSDGLLRVGGRIKHSGLDLNDINPIIVPGRHHLSVLLIRHYHEAVKHQGRHFTEVPDEMMEVDLCAIS